jgi:hypothetical protein
LRHDLNRRFAPRNCKNTRLIGNDATKSNQITNCRNRSKREIDYRARRWCINGWAQTHYNFSSPVPYSHSLTPSSPCTPLFYAFRRQTFSLHYYDHPSTDLPAEQRCLCRQAHGSAQSLVLSLFTSASQNYGQRFFAPKHVRTASGGG